jgi:N-acetylmuramic acid 6-phosphate etherase
MPESRLFYEISLLGTEQKNPKTEFIDIASTNKILELINDEDQLVPQAVRNEIPYIEQAVDRITEAFRSGGRLFYIGSGTSGRLGIVDASECPPTFGSDPAMVQGIIAGGKEAIFKAQEGAEDSTEKGAKEVRERDIAPPDIICGIAASGRTPFVKGALLEAHERGVYAILITTISRDKIAELGIYHDLAICPDVGPEVIAGSTRMKSGTAQKLVLNMLTTASMIKLGKTLGNVMIDLQLTNNKLKERAKRIIMELTGASYDDAERTLTGSGGSVKVTLVMILGKVTKDKAIELLNNSNGFVRVALAAVTQTK